MLPYLVYLALVLGAALVMAVLYGLLDGWDWFLLVIFAYYTAGFGAIGFFIPWAVTGHPPI